MKLQLRGNVGVGGNIAAVSCVYKNRADGQRAEQRGDGEQNRQLLLDRTIADDGQR